VDAERRLELVERPPTEEVVTREELRELLETSERPRHYIGLEISGPLHLGSLVLTGYKLRDFLEAGFRTTVFLADWHSYLNDKLGGDWDRIRRASRYYAEAFRAFAPGVEVVLGSELYARTPEYWEWLVRFAKRVTLARASRTLTIAGRRAGENLDMDQYIYPLMQATDIRALEVDVAHAGMDQRKVHMLAREVFPKLGWRTPIAVHHHLLPGLQGPRSEGLDEDREMDLKVSSKMSKSKPEGAIFIHDPREVIERKLLAAWCPQGVEEGNPVMEIAKYIAFRARKELRVERPAKYGGDVVYGSYEELARDFREGRLHPLDLKRAIAAVVDEAVDPVRRILASDPEYLSLLGA
jgi:tyrosyl-tRNA synthetase